MFYSLFTALISDIINSWEYIDNIQMSIEKFSAWENKNGVGSFGQIWRNGWIRLNIF